MIPKGLQLQVTSCENDADNYKTKILSGLSEDEVRFYVELAKLFRSRNGRHDDTCYGNTTYDHRYKINWSDLIAKVKAIAEKHRTGFVLIIGDQFDFDETSTDEWQDFIHELACKLLGSSEDFMFRVFETFKVYHFPEDVTEVTENFK
jgi:hypothetical protein